jgi:hypothetical protein
MSLNEAASSCTSFAQADALFWRLAKMTVRRIDLRDRKLNSFTRHAAFRIQPMIEGSRRSLYYE